MVEALSNPSLITLFFLSFIAATLLPVGSEWYLALIIHRGADIADAVAVATCGNYLGACTSYLVGLWGATFITERVFRIKPKDLNNAQSLYAKLGSWSLLLSWLPIIGDPLCVVGGIFRVNFFKYSLLVVSGKFVRYFAIAYLVHLGVTSP